MSFLKDLIKSRNFSDFRKEDVLIYSIGIVFFWAGLLKVIPVEAPVGPIIEDTVFFLPIAVSVPLVGMFEILIGINFLLKRLKLGIPLLLIHQILTFLSILILPFSAFKGPWLSLLGFQVPWVFDIEAIFIFKNLIIIGSALLLADSCNITFERPFFESRDILIQGIFILFFLAFTFHWTTSGPYNPEVGLFVTDFNNNGYPDLLATGRNEILLFENIEGKELRPSNALPNLYIEPPTEEGLFKDWRPPTGTINTAVFFDYNNNGWEDLYLATSKGEGIFLENKEGGFVERDVGLSEKLETPYSAAAADYTGNGCEDLFIAQAGTLSVGGMGGYKGAEDLDIPLGKDNGAENLLFKNNCSKFELANNTGIKGNKWSLATSFTDFNGNGWPDIHVANDFNNDEMYINQKNGTFNRVRLGKSTNRNSMSSEIADLENNGYKDIFVSNIYLHPTIREHTPFRFETMDERYLGHNLLINNKENGFEDKAEQYQVRNQNSIAEWGVAAEIEDFNNNGKKEIFQVLAPMTEMFQWAPNQRPNILTQEDGSFRPLSTEVEPSSSRSVVSMDFDRDGSLDLVVGDSNRGIILYENKLNGNMSRPSFDVYEEFLKAHQGFENYGFNIRSRSLDFRDEKKQNWFQVDINRSINEGTKVVVNTENETYKSLGHSNTDFRSQSTRLHHFGLGSTDKINNVTIKWRDGSEKVIESPDINQRINIGKNSF